MSNDKHMIDLQVTVFSYEETNEQEIVSRIFDAMAELYPKATTCVSPISIPE